MPPAPTRSLRSFRVALVCGLTGFSGLALAFGVLGPRAGYAGGALALGLGLAALAAAIAIGLLLRAGASARSAQLVRDHVLAHATRAIVSADAHGTIATFSRGAERLFGRSAAEVNGRLPLTALIAPAEFDRRVRPGTTPFDTLVGRASDAGTDSESEWACARADGTIFPARVSVSPLVAGDRVDGYLVMIADATEARRAQQQREEADVRLTKIGSQVPGMIFQLRRSDRGRPAAMVYASDGIRDIFGLDAAALATDASAIWDRVHADDRPRVAQSFFAAEEQLCRWQCELRSRPRDGEIRWLWVNALPERQADGAVTWHGFIADVTARKQAEAAHEENRALLQSILASVDLGVFLVDVLPGGDFRFVEVNPAYERLTGIAAAEIRGKTPAELVPVIPAEMAACLKASFRRGLDAVSFVEYEEPFFVRGRLLWWLTRLTPLRDAAGNVVRLVGRSLDITERKAVEQRVQSLTERLQLAAEAAELGIWDYDVVHGRLVCDDRMLEIYGVRPEAFEGTLAAWRERIHPDDRARVDQEYREAADGRKTFNTSFRILRPDGEEREVRARGSVQRNPAGRPVRFVAVHWDVTDERRAQAEIEFARDQAEDLNRQLEDALERAHRLAQEAAAATVAKSEFLANMSHEIRTPLNAIIGMSGLLLGTELNHEQREFAETIRSGGDGLLALVNDILDYSKIESGKLELEHRTFDLRHCIESSIDVLASRATEKRLDLLFAIDPTVPEAVIGDLVRLRQVIVNLLSNAVKFTAHGDVVLDVVTIPAQDSGRIRLRFGVHDSGIGIPPDRMDRLFKTFSQVDASTTRQYGGTGLGLAISKRIVELMGGRIWVESTWGQGSTFWFEIELPPSQAPTKAYASGRVPLFTGRRILVVDDNATCGRVLSQQLARWGFVPRAVSSPADAELLLRRGETFDLLLVDHDLGDVSGAECAQALRNIPTAAELPIALMTVPGQSRPREEVRIAATVNKPVKTGTLFDALSLVLQGQRHPAGQSTDPLAGLAVERPLKILLAEDNPVNQRVAVLMLQRLGYQADVAANGREAVAAALRQRYDLVLMDVQMPEMDGLQASREICARTSGAWRPRIVAMTANASVGDRDRCLDAGMSDFLTKPVRAEDLRRALEETPLRDGPAANVVVLPAGAAS